MAPFTILLILTMLVNIWTIINSFFLFPLLSSRSLSKFPKVSLLIPLRNERDNVSGLLDSLKNISYPDVEFILLDDQSEDGTYDLLCSHTEEDKRFVIKKGKELPDGWNGKVYACHQLASYAEGNYLLFLDADARVSKGIIHQSLATLRKHKASMLSGFPHYPNSNFLAHLLVPLQHMVVLFHLPLMAANLTTKPAFTAACGIFILIERDAYEQIGGHESVKGSLVEDVHLAREVKKHDLKMILVNITPSVISYMYNTAQETWEGFKKNIFSGIGRSKTMVFLLSIIYIVIFVLPFLYSCYAFISGNFLYLLPYLLIVAFKMYIDIRTGHPLWLSWFLPLSAVLLITLMWHSMIVSLKGENYQWKGRFYK